MSSSRRFLVYSLYFIPYIDGTKSSPGYLLPPSLSLPHHSTPSSRLSTRDRHIGIRGEMTIVCSRLFDLMWWQMNGNNDQAGNKNQKFSLLTVLACAAPFPFTFHIDKDLRRNYMSSFYCKMLYIAAYQCDGYISFLFLSFFHLFSPGHPASNTPPVLSSLCSG